MSVFDIKTCKLHLDNQRAVHLPFSLLLKFMSINAIMQTTVLLVKMAKKLPKGSKSVKLCMKKRVPRNMCCIEVGQHIKVCNTDNMRAIPMFCKHCLHFK